MASLYDTSGEQVQQPWCLSPGNLETWYNGNIQHGTEKFASDCRSAILSVVGHIHRNCSSNILDFDVDKVVKGGSLGKGTMVKDLSDVDLVAFVNKPYLKPIAEIGKEEYKRALSKIISEIASTLRGVANIQNIRYDEYLVKFKIQVKSRWIDVDLLPTTENVPYQSSYRNMFLSMLDVGHGTRGFYSAAFVQHQKRFVGERPGYLKALIRLVKFWASKYLPAKLKKSYPLELITIYLWEKAGKPSALSKAQGLRSVLEVLTNLDSLRVYWNYMSGVDDQLNETIIRKLDMKRPIILDPANPTNNVGGLYQEYDNKEVIKAAAEKTLRTTLLSDVSAW
ncbi:2'-5'-oligoadenylate synthase 1A-like [Asterias amurensis]|uniref:2'-5'-oligoadenylate synthase 1A-like n=1 Tax=Asterias amurensis TaxID=7602 RepID=UPI003AB4E872